MRIGVASFSHETCTFCPNPTTIEDFEKGGVFYGESVISRRQGIPGYVNGFIKAAMGEQDVELVGIIDASRAWGGSSGSWLTRKCFDKYSYDIVEGLKKAGKIDGVLLALHGAMAVEGCLKPEAEIVRRVRLAIGNKPIMVTLDLHANEDHELVEMADGVFIIKTYPHVDSEGTGMKATSCIIKTIRGNFSPTMAIKKPGIITPSVFQGTDSYPAKAIMDRAKDWEKSEKDVYSVSVAFGFAYADVPDAGASVIVVTDNDKELAERVANDVSSYIWRLREAFANKKVPKTREGVSLAKRAAKEGQIPVVIADHSDRTGDSTHIIRELINQEVDNFVVATIADQRVIKKILCEASIGDIVTVDVGGYMTVWSGSPISITGNVEYLGECEYVHNGPMRRGGRSQLGKVAVLNIGRNNHVIISPTLHQVIDSAIFSAVNLELNEFNIIAIKSRVHFRAFYNNVAGKIIEVDAPGLGPADLTQIKYKNIPKDIYPIGEKWRS